MASYKQKAEAFCRENNIELDDSCDRDNIDISVYTPKGIRFKATDCHTAVTAFSRFEGTKADGWRHVWEDLSFGIEECDEPNCGYCERGKRNV
jgi:hypothetical protein